MGDVHLVEIINKKDLGVKFENRIRIVSFWQRTLNLATSLPCPNPCISKKSYTPLRRVSLVEYFCTQGLLTLVAGESHAQACFGPCCMSVFEVIDDEE